MGQDTFEEVDRVALEGRRATEASRVRFTFLAGGTKSRFHVDNFWIDPRMAR